MPCQRCSLYKSDKKSKKEEKKLWDASVPKERIAWLKFAKYDLGSIGRFVFLYVGSESGNVPSARTSEGTIKACQLLQDMPAFE